MAGRAEDGRRTSAPFAAEGGAPVGGAGSLPAAPSPDWAGGLPPELLEMVARAVPAGDRLCFRRVCKGWAAAGAEVAAVPPGERPLGPGKVTRTRGEDAAASVARAEMALAALEGPARERFKSRLCAYAAGGGHLEVLKWARGEGCPWNERTCAAAAEGGHLEVLKWARARGCPWDEDTCLYAALNGHLAVLRWARAEGCPWIAGTCSWAAENGHLHVLKWARAHGCPWDEMTCAMAAAGGHLEVLQWARAQGCLE